MHDQLKSIELRRVSGPERDKAEAINVEFFQVEGLVQAAEEIPETLPVSGARVNELTDEHTLLTKGTA